MTLIDNFPNLGAIGKVIYREIGRDIHGGGAEEAGYLKHRSDAVANPGDAAQRVAAHAKRQGNPNSGHWPHQQYDPLSIEATEGTNLYVVALDPNARTAFGPGPFPIVILPPSAGMGLLKDVGLIYTKGDGSVAYMPAASIPNDFASVPAEAMLIFTCERAALVAAWTNSVDGAGHPGAAMRIPFAFNLWDTDTKQPVWTFGRGHRSHHDHGDHAQVKTHGGIHPNEPSSDFY